MLTKAAQLILFMMFICIIVIVLGIMSHAVSSHNMKVDSVPFKKGDTVFIPLNKTYGVVFKHYDTYCSVKYPLTTGEIIRDDFEYTELRKPQEHDPEHLTKLMEKFRP